LTLLARTVYAKQGFVNPALTVGRPSICLCFFVCPSVPSFARSRGGFAAERRADRRYRSTAAAARRSAANASRVTFTAAADVEKTNTNLLSEKKTAVGAFIR